MSEEELAVSTLLLAAAAGLVEQIHAGVVDRGFADLRPVHGFVFARVAAGGATVGDVAEHLGVTKQAASQMVEELERKGYVQRHRHPGDGRARLLQLTERGWACTRAADAAATAVVGRWAADLGRDRLRALLADLRRIARPGPLRPAVW